MTRIPSAVIRDGKKTEMTKKIRKGKFERPKIVENEIDNISFHITMDTQSPPALLLDNAPKGRKKTIPLTITHKGFHFGPKSKTYYIPNWNNIQNMTITIELNGETYSI